MTDRELLEKAAKAVGMPNPCYMEIYQNKGIDRGPTQSLWNPLTDDGDALRLAVRLEISIGRFYDCSVPACFASWNDRENSLWEPASDDACAATRRAIVRAAAAIGEAMQ